MTTVFDAVVACVIPFVAWQVLATGDLERAVVLFIAFGLLAALAWARLDAPDVALVEASIGAGLTGALLVTTVRSIGSALPPEQHRRTGLLAPLIACVAAVLEAALFYLPDPAVGLEPMVAARLREAGVEHPVTAVLLDYRGYDTLLEAAVLVEAVVVVAIRVRSRPARAARDTGPLGVLVRLFVPAIVLVAGYLLWRGTNGPGGAFPAAAVIAGAGILMVAGGMLRIPATGSVFARLVLVAGPAVFILIADLPLAAGDHLLEYPRTGAGMLIAVIELGLVCSIALVLLSFVPLCEERP